MIEKDRGGRGWEGEMRRRRERESRDDVDVGQICTHL